MGKGSSAGGAPRAAAGSARSLWPRRRPPRPSPLLQRTCRFPPFALLLLLLLIFSRLWIWDRSGKVSSGALAAVGREAGRDGCGAPRSRAPAAPRSRAPAGFPSEESRPEPSPRRDPPLQCRVTPVSLPGCAGTLCLAVAEPSLSGDPSGAACSVGSSERGPAAAPCFHPKTLPRGKGLRGGTGD